MNELPADQYDGFAARYAVHAEHSIYNVAYERPAVRTVLPETLDGMTILDAGCAAGGHAVTFIAGGARVVGIDGSAELVCEFRKRTNGSEAHVANLGEPLAFLAGGRFDFVVTSLTMHYLETWLPTLREFFRVMKPGGTLVLSTHHPSSLPLEQYFEKRIVRDVWEIDGVPTPVAFWHRSMQEILDPICDAGFVLDRVIEPQIPWAALPAERRDAAKLPAFLIIRATKPQGLVG